MKALKIHAARLVRFGLVCWVAGMARAAESELRLDLGGGVGMGLVLVPAGEFAQGSPEGEAGRAGDETARQVVVSKEFYIGKTAVTRGQWERFVKETRYRTEAENGTSGGYGWDGAALVQKKSFSWRDPGFLQTADHPVSLVTFPDAQAFCAWLQRMVKRKTTLPTEAQWEYACRAGSTTPWHGGGSADGVAWHKGNAGNGTRAVDSKPANAWGVTISGNVSEWCLDWYAPYQAGPVVDPRQDNPNLSDKPRRVLRGGSWIRDAKNTRSAARYRVDPRSRNADIGFRVVCAVEMIAPLAPRKIIVPPSIKVEAEPGDVPAPRDVVDVPVQHAPSPRQSIGRGLGSVLCLLIPVGLILLFVRFLLKHGKTEPNPFVVQPKMPPPPPLHQQPVRMVEDGFWIDGVWPVGASLIIRYVIGGVTQEQNLIYQPGKGGQFIFTGVTPDSVTVVAENGDLIPPPLVVPPPMMPETRDDFGSVSPLPPTHPTAY